MGLGKVIALNVKQHVYKVDNCAMCGRVNKADQIGVYFPKEKEIKHISFCVDCYMSFLNNKIIRERVLENA